jgi:hypothetical protein
MMLVSLLAEIDFNAPTAFGVPLGMLILFMWWMSSQNNRKNND